MTKTWQTWDGGSSKWEEVTPKVGEGENGRLCEKERFPPKVGEGKKGDRNPQEVDFQGRKKARNKCEIRPPLWR